MLCLALEFCHPPPPLPCDGLFTDECPGSGALVVQSLCSSLAALLSPALYAVVVSPGNGIGLPLRVRCIYAPCRSAVACLVAACAILQANKGGDVGMSVDSSRGAGAASASMKGGKSRKPSKNTTKSKLKHQKKQQESLRKKVAGSLGMEVDGATSAGGTAGGGNPGGRGKGSKGKSKGKGQRATGKAGKNKHDQISPENVATLQVCVCRVCVRAVCL